VSARAAALHTLRTWTPPTPHQAALCERFVRHLEENDDGLRRTCAPAHLTAGALVFSSGLDAVLLNLHGKARRWFHFGGHWEPGDASLLATATREATEESRVTGLMVHPEPVHLDLHQVGFCGSDGRTVHLDVRYAALAPAGAQGRAGEESLDVRWWPLDGLPELEAKMHELIALARARLHDVSESLPDSPASSRAPEEYPSSQARARSESG
jgi:ADP-ribose pyrophosphatase YjhB (NUDIX family)